jgi:N-acetyl-gamma-glutamyl-phosphate reductase
LIKVSIVGVSGYGGIELFHILNLHPEVEIAAISSRTYAGQKLGQIYPHLSHIDIECKEYSPEELAETSDVVFTSVPHGGPAIKYAMPIKKSGKKFIDLSADFRLKDINIYEHWYKCKHTNPELLKEAVYGLPELHREEIKKAWLIGNPGCYTTNAILSLYPLIKNKLINEKSIIVDAKSGVSGAGRTAKPHLHFPELDESFQAYGVANHRHTPEIEQELSLFSENEVILTFVPHLVPMVRGILNVSYGELIKDVSLDELYNIYTEIYKPHPFVRILKETLPNTKFVAGTNFIDIAIKKDERTNKVIIISALDNLIKGASGQAVHNMNLMFGFKETLGLDFKPLFP